MDRLEKGEGEGEGEGEGGGTGSVSSTRPLAESLEMGPGTWVEGLVYVSWLER